ncbi:MAG: RNA polymerase sigma-70 factor [Ktedonobacteraceae bacterium]|nr:RNA polymerase sigma-70 factor [Ktedonobacteraceae bacterium]
MRKQVAQVFTQYRVLLFSIAYRMLGSATDAEDIVQEAFVRWLQESPAELQSPKAYLSTIVVRLCINELHSARVQHERYMGPWLPEPLLTSQCSEQTDTAALAESVSFAFLILLENLAPLERAVFLLHDVFDYGYTEIAALIEKSEANCRQILHRARQRLGQRRSRFNVSNDQQEYIAAQFLRASTSGDMQGLLQLLTDDVVFTADSGGKVRAALKPVHGPDKVTRGLLGGLHLPSRNLRASIEEINGQPAIVGYLDDRLYGVVLFETDGERVHRVYVVVNPEKLRWLK